MRDDHTNVRRYQRRRHRRIGLLFLLLCLLIIIFGQPLLGILVSLAIIIMLLALIAAVFVFTSRIWNSRLRQHSSDQQPTEPFYTPPEALTLYEQGYRAEESAAQQPQAMATLLSLPQPYEGPSAALPEPGASVESNVLTLLQLLGQLDDSGALTDEFESQQQRMLQSDETKEATEPGSTSLLLPGTPYEEQPQAQYAQELPPMTR